MLFTIVFYSELNSTIVNYLLIVYIGDMILNLIPESIRPTNLQLFHHVLLYISLDFFFLSCYMITISSPTSFNENIHFCSLLEVMNIIFFYKTNIFLYNKLNLTSKKYILRGHSQNMINDASDVILNVFSMCNLPRSE